MPRSAGPNWGSALDFERALINCHRDFLGDWYRDPWGWPELDWILASGRTECLFARLNTDGIKHTARLEACLSVVSGLSLSKTDRIHASLGLRVAP